MQVAWMLTDLKGRTVPVFTAWITHIAYPDHVLYPQPKAGAVIYLSGEAFAVQETVEDLIAKINSLNP